MTDRELTPYELEQKRQVEAIHRRVALKRAARVRAARTLAKQAERQLQSATLRELMMTVAARRARDGGAQ